MSDQIKDVSERLRDEMKKQGMTDQEIIDFAIASDHPYQCQCQLCQEWWRRMGGWDQEL